MLLAMSGPAQPSAALPWGANMHLPLDIHRSQVVSPVRHDLPARFPFPSTHSEAHEPPQRALRTIP